MRDTHRTGTSNAAAEARHLSRALLPLFVAGCALFAAGPSLSPRLAGCYSVEAPSYGAAHAAITGFRALPSRIILDTAYRGRVRVPRWWRLADSPRGNMAGLRLEGRHWVVRGGAVYFDPYERLHTLGADSIIVAFSGWGGTMSAYLERTANGFTGFAAFAPTMNAAEVPAVRVTLRSATCQGDFV